MITEKGKRIKSYFSTSMLASRPGDEQVDNWIQEDLNQLWVRALIKTHLDESATVRNPVMIIGPRLINTGGAPFGVRKGKDNYIRYMPIGATIINFTQHQLVIYQCALDLTTSNPLAESTHEFFYRDIVSLETITESRTETSYSFTEQLLAEIPLLKNLAQGKVEQYNSAETFILTTSGGTNVKVALSEKILVESVGGGTIPTHVSEQSIRAVRKMLREKKSGDAV
ncbi:MAG: hypothetical protein SF053_00550 [Bacteroidia bacterium]|nr:hypothetical protein [Bacteroidia bacterium]